MVNLTKCCVSLTTEVSTSTISTLENKPETWTELFLSLIGKEELQLFTLIGLTILILLIIACCIGCNGCCCRACCCARATKFGVNSCKLPTFQGREDNRLGQGIAMVPMTRCCFHPHHCRMDLETPYACDCRRICRACNGSGYFPKSTPDNGHFEQEGPTPKNNSRTSTADQSTNTHRVRFDIPCETQGSEGINRRAQAPRRQSTPSSTPPPQPPSNNIGWNSNYLGSSNASAGSEDADSCPQSSSTPAQVHEEEENW